LSPHVDTLWVCGSPKKQDDKAKCFLAPPKKHPLVWRACPTRPAGRDAPREGGRRRGEDIVTEEITIRQKAADAASAMTLREQTENLWFRGVLCWMRLSGNPVTSMRLTAAFTTAALETSYSFCSSALYATWNRHGIRRERTRRIDQGWRSMAGGI
jgi:hypothetical protein